MINVISIKVPKGPTVRSGPPPVIAPVTNPIVPNSLEPKPPGFWEKAVGAWDNPRMDYQEFLDLRLTPEQWANKYGKTPKEHRDWKRDVLIKNKKKKPSKLQNWLVRSLKNTFRKLK